MTSVGPDLYADMDCSACGVFRIELAITGELLMESMTPEGRVRLARLQALVRDPRATPPAINRKVWERLGSSPQGSG